MMITQNFSGYVQQMSWLSRLEAVAHSDQSQPTISIMIYEPCQITASQNTTI